MLELFSRRRRRPDLKSLAVAASGGALAACALTGLMRAQRRARARDQMTSAVTHFFRLFDKARRDARNRALGASARIAGRTRRGGISDEKLAARVRSTLGRFTSHPHAIEAYVTNGYVVLEGPILRSEVDELVQVVRKVRGVRDVESRLDVHERAEDVPSLQGPGRMAHVPELLQEHWTPSLRIGAGLLGTLAIGAAAARRRRTVGIGLAGLGALLLARAYFDEPTARLLGLGATRRSVELEKTITIRAPVEDVFAYWADFERFPEFMSHVEGVKKTGDRLSHWKVRGPLGKAVEWDAETTSFVPNERIAWKSVGGSLVKSAGIVRFEPVEDGRATRLDVRLSYNPVFGYVGHSIAALFRVDPKKSLDDDLLRLKSLLEEGKTTAHGRQVTRDAIPVATSVGTADDTGARSAR
jgi:uncharacterized membrane protein